MLPRVNLVPGYRRLCEFVTGVKEDGTSCYLCGRLRDTVNKNFPHNVQLMNMDHLVSLESDAVTESSTWNQPVEIEAPQEFETGPRSSRTWTVREIDSPRNMLAICTQCNNLKGGRSLDRLPTDEERNAVRDFHIAKFLKNQALFQSKAGPVLGEMPAALAAHYRNKAKKEYNSPE